MLIFSSIFIDVLCVGFNIINIVKLTHIAIKNIKNIGTINKQATPRPNWIKIVACSGVCSCVCVCVCVCVRKRGKERMLPYSGKIWRGI